MTLAEKLHNEGKLEGLKEALEKITAEDPAQPHQKVTQQLSMVSPELELRNYGAGITSRHRQFAAQGFEHFFHGDKMRISSAGN